MGSSLGASISFALLWLHDDVFAKAAGLSFPPHGYDHFLFDFISKEARPSRAIEAYLDHGTHGGDATYEPWVSSFIQKLGSLPKLPLKVTSKKFPYAGHTESDWSRRLHHALLFLLEK